MLVRYPVPYVSATLIACAPRLVAYQPGFRIRIRIRINLSCWIRFRIRIQIADPDPDPGGQKWPTKIEKSPEFHVFKYWMFSFEGWGFSCSLGDLYGGLGISKLQFLIKKKNNKKFSAVNFFYNFWSSKLWIWIRKEWTLDPDLEGMNPDLWLLRFMGV